MFNVMFKHDLWSTIWRKKLNINLQLKNRYDQWGYGGGEGAGN